MQAITFEQDNFLQRRASQRGAGVAYDPESLLTGAEIAAGLGYGDKRVWESPYAKAMAHAGLLSTEEVLRFGPRMKAAPLAGSSAEVLVAPLPGAWSSHEISES